MPFDFKKEYKEFYMPKQVPAVITVPSMNYIAVSGTGNPQRSGRASVCCCLYAENVREIRI